MTARLKLGVELRLEDFGKNRESFWRLPSTDTPEEPAALIAARTSKNGHLCGNNGTKISYENGLVIDAFLSNNGHQWTNGDSVRAFPAANSLTIYRRAIIKLMMLG